MRAVTKSDRHSARPQTRTLFKDGMKLKVLDLFAGIGGAALALKATGRFRTVAYCEKDGLAQRVLTDLMSRGNLDRADIIPDVRDITSPLPTGNVDLISAGFPCQDVSSIGNTKSLKDGERSKLVWEVVRLT